MRKQRETVRVLSDLAGLEGDDELQGGVEEVEHSGAHRGGVQKSAVRALIGRRQQQRAPRPPQLLTVPLGRRRRR